MIMNSRPMPTDVDVVILALWLCCNCTKKIDIDVEKAMINFTNPDDAVIFDEKYR